MLCNPHDTCAEIINNLRISGLTYTLNETPYSVYLTLRKKFTKEFTPRISDETSKTSSDGRVNKHEYETAIAELSEALRNEITQHNSTKNQLSQTNAAVEKLQNELAQEVDDHAKSEHTLRQLKSEAENLQLELDKEVKYSTSINEDKESLALPSSGQVFWY